SWHDLNPIGAAGSVAQGIHNGEQVGVAYFGSSTMGHAGLWNGSAASWVDLNPATATESYAWAVFSGRQVGYVIDSRTRASIWNGTSASWEDLSVAINNFQGDSYAMGVWSDASTLYVIGYAISYDTQLSTAVLWTTAIVPSCYANC